MLPIDMGEQYSSPVMGTRHSSQQWLEGSGVSEASDEPMREELLNEIGNVAWALSPHNDNDVTLGIDTSLLSGLGYDRSSSTVSSHGGCCNDSYLLKGLKSGQTVENVHLKSIEHPNLQQALVESFSAMGLEMPSSDDYDDEDHEDDEYDDGKENSISVDVLSGKSKAFPLQVLSAHCALNSDDEDKSSDQGSLDGDDDLILDEEPPYKKRNPKVQEHESAHCNHPNVLNTTSDKVKFIERIGDIDDKTWLPRYFQGHRVKQSPILRSSSQIEYRYNRRCPKSSNSCESHVYGFKERTSTLFISNLTCWRYERRHCLTGRVERMCRLCRGENWILKVDFDTHLLLSHGILQPPGLSPSLLPFPRSVFEVSQGKWVNRSVECPHCFTWIELGQSSDGRLQYSKSQGLYFNYFLHILKTHQDVHS